MNPMFKNEIFIGYKKIFFQLRELMDMKLLIREKIEQFGFLSLVLILHLMILREEVEVLLLLQEEVMGCDLEEVEICFINLRVMTL